MTARIECLELAFFLLSLS